MHRHTRVLTAAAIWLMSALALADTPLPELLRDFEAQGAGGFSAAAGAALWTQPFSAGRRCSDCHGEDLRRDGRHVSTGKAIAPLAPSVNAKRLSERAAITKWLTRNCKWTLGRECTAQEQGDLLSFIAAQ